MRKFILSCMVLCLIVGCSNQNNQIKKEIQKRIRTEFVAREGDMISLNDLINMDTLDDDMTQILKNAFIEYDWNELKDLNDHSKTQVSDNETHISGKLPVKIYYNVELVDESMEWSLSNIKSSSYLLVDIHTRGLNDQELLALLLKTGVYSGSIDYMGGVMPGGFSRSYGDYSANNGTFDFRLSPPHFEAAPVVYTASLSQPTEYGVEKNLAELFDLIESETFDKNVSSDSNTIELSMNLYTKAIDENNELKELRYIYRFIAVETTMNRETKEVKGKIHYQAIYTSMDIHDEDYQGYIDQNKFISPYFDFNFIDFAKEMLVNKYPNEQYYLPSVGILELIFTIGGN